jgi:protein TonB
MSNLKSLTIACLVALGLIEVAIAQTGEKIYRIGEEGVTAPTVLSKTEPAYTDEARNAKIEGMVELSVEIDADGLAQNIRVVRSLGGGLDQSAVAAIQEWRFKPGEKDRKPVRVAARIGVNFHLK